MTGRAAQLPVPLAVACLVVVRLFRPVAAAPLVVGLGLLVVLVCLVGRPGLTLLILLILLVRWLLLWS